MTDRKKGLLQGLLTNTVQKITLIFFGIFSTQQMCDTLFIRSLARVMPSCDQIRLEALSSFEKNAELDFLIAEHIRIRRPTLRIFRKHLVDHFFAIQIFKVKRNERYAELSGDTHRIATIATPRAFPCPRIFCIRPIFDKSTND